jgi:Zn-dependent M32 family carboxypeptidase
MVLLCYNDTTAFTATSHRLSGENDIETAQIKGFLKQRRFYTNVPKDLSDAFNRKRVEAMTAWKQAHFLPLSAG